MTENATRTFLDQIPHLSASSVGDFIRCPLLWAGRRIYKWPEPPTPALAIGTAVHAALAAHHKGEDAELVLLEAWKAVRGMTPPPGTLERALEALALYVADAVIDPLYDRTETFVRATIPGVAVPFIGYIDCLTANHPDADTIHEWKSGAAKYWSQERVDSELQLTSYWWTYQQQCDGTPPRKIVLHAMNTASYPVTVTHYETTRTPVQIEGFLETVQDVYRRMGAEDLEAKCRPGRCRFPEQCAEWRATNPQGKPPRLVVPAALPGFE